MLVNMSGEVYPNSLLVGMQTRATILEENIQTLHISENSSPLQPKIKPAYESIISNFMFIAAQFIVTIVLNQPDGRQLMIT